MKNEPSPPPRTIDWHLTTWEGARRAQTVAFMRLTLREKLEAVEAMCDITRHLAERRRSRIRGRDPGPGP